jgi:DNA-binding NarL/FixJ family response regulator
MQEKPSIAHKVDDVRVMIMEDHRCLCDALNRITTATDGMTCSGHFNTAAETLAAVENDPPDIISIDLDMPDQNGLSVIRQIREKWPQIRCIVFSGHADESYVQSAFDAGAMGYVCKENVKEFIECIHVVAAGDCYLSERFIGNDKLVDLQNADLNLRTRLENK